MEQQLMKKKKSKTKVSKFLRDTFVYLTGRQLPWIGCISKKYNKMDEEPYFLSNANPSFIVLSHVFQYLSIRDLQRAACVCKTWNYVASSKTLWKSIRLEELRVTDWPALGDTLLRSGSEELDLWEMILPEDMDEEARMWKRISKALKRARSLKKMDMGHCPPEAVSLVARVAPQLTSLVSLDIQDGSLSLNEIGKLQNLTELKLNSFSKRFELSSFEGLKDLKKLKTLSITEVVSLAGIENCLPSSLDTLELGPWHTLSNKMSTIALPRLKGLKKLRMEQAWDVTLEEMRPFFEVVSTLPSLTHLELINFPALEGFDSLIAKLTNIKTLHYMLNVRIFNSASMNYSFMGGVSKLKNTLKQLVWELPRDLEYSQRDTKWLDIVPIQAVGAGYVDFLNSNDFWWNLRTLLPQTEILFVNVTVTPTHRHSIYI